MQSIIIASIAAFGTVMGIIIQIWHQHRTAERQARLQKELSASTAALDERKTKIAEEEAEQATIRFWRHEAETYRREIERVQEELDALDARFKTREREVAESLRTLATLETQVAAQTIAITERDIQIATSAVTIRTLSQRIAELERRVNG